MNWTSFVFIKSISLFNNAYLIYNNTVNSCKTIFYYLKNYYNGHHDVWLFIPSHTFPLSLNNLNNDINVDWIYDNYDNTLTCTRSEKQNNCKLSWLSAKIKIISKKENEYNIDNFIEIFSVNTNFNTPSLYIIFMCWCAHTKQWFKMDDTVEFHIINDDGEEIILDIVRDTSFIIKNNKLYNEQKIR